MYGILSAEDKLQHQEPDVHVAAFYTTNRYSKIITNDSLWIFFFFLRKKNQYTEYRICWNVFFFNRKKKSIQSIEFARILTRDKYLIHVSFLTNPMFLCTRPKQIPRSALHIVYNSCICMCVLVYMILKAK